MRAIAILMVLMMAEPVLAQMSFDPVGTTPPGRYRVGGGLTLSSVEYEVDDFEVEADRTIFGASFAGSVAEQTDVFGLVGLIADAELDFDPGEKQNDGSGFTFGGGARSLVHQQGRIGISAYGIFTYLSESYDDDVKVDVSIMELAGGGAAEYRVSRTVRPYAAMTLTLLSNGDVDVEDADSEDMERDHIVSIHLGANFDLGSTVLRPEMIILGEQTLAFSAVAFL